MSVSMGWVGGELAAASWGWSTVSAQFDQCINASEMMVDPNSPGFNHHSLTKEEGTH